MRITSLSLSHTHTRFDSLAFHLLSLSLVSHGSEIPPSKQLLDWRSQTFPGDLSLTDGAGT
jgi:hypothetical protein